MNSKYDENNPMAIHLINDEIRLCLQNQRIYAIKSIRVRYGCGLKEAKDAVESFMRDVGLVTTRPCGACNGTGTIEDFGITKGV